MIKLKGFLILELCIIIGSFMSVQAQNESNFTVGLTDDGAGVVIKRYIGSETRIKIPATIQDMPVIEIGKGAFTAERINTEIDGIEARLISLELPPGVTKIGQQAFQSQKALTLVKLSNTVRIIDSGAFARCSSLSSIVIPDSVTSIGDGAFLSCTNLKSVKIPNSVTSIGGGAFWSSGIESFTWPSSITVISSTTSSSIVYRAGLGMFENCKNLKTIVLPDGVTTIDDYAFQECISLESIQFPSTISSIGNYAFKNCINLNEVITPKNIEKISFTGSNSFLGCEKLKLSSQSALIKSGYSGKF